MREACDTNHLPVGVGPLQDPVGTSMGNPHATFFVDDAAAIPLGELGPKLEHDRFFPERANIGVAQLVGDEPAAAARLGARRRPHARLRLGRLRRRRGGGSRRGLVPRKAEVVMDGGTLTIEWLRDGHVLMTGGISLRLQGRLDPRC